MSIKLLVLILLFIAIMAFIIFACTVLFKNKSNISIMLLGLTITITGGIFGLNGGIIGIEYIMALIGLAISIGGFAKKEKINN